MKRTNIYITDQQHSALLQLHQDTGVKPAESVRRALDEHLSKRGYMPRKPNAETKEK